MVAPDAGDSGRGTVTEAVAAPLSALAPAVVEGCVRPLLFEHAVPARHTAATAASCRHAFRMVSSLEHKTAAGRRGERDHHNIRTFPDAVRSIVALVAGGHEESDLFAWSWLVTGHRRPADGIEVPVHRVVAHRTAVLV